MKRKQALDAKSQELITILKLWHSALQPFEPDGEWRGQGWIANARQWIDLLYAKSAAKEMPEFIAEAGGEARKAFHTLNELREEKRRESEYARFIVEAGVLADEARELID